MVSSAPTDWRPRSAWAGVLAFGRHGCAHGAPGVSVMPLEGLGLATIVGSERDATALEQALTELVGVPPPATLRLVSGCVGDLVWSGPRRWLLVSKRRDIAAFAASKLAGLAAVSDQSDARAILRLFGPRARDALAKGCLIDLHPRVFAPGDTALTTIAHISLHLWHVDDRPAYDLAVARSLAASFWSWLSAATAEFGCEVIAASERA